MSETSLNMNYEPEIIVDTDTLSREDWLSYRKLGIGGSDVAAIMGISPFATIRDLYNDKLGIEPLIEEEESNWVAKEVGHRLEDLVAEIFAKKTGLTVFPVRKMFRHPLYPFMLADVDFFIIFPDGSYGILECKTCNYNARTKWEDGGIPDNYILQVRHYLSVMNMNKAYIACLYGNNENEFVIRPIERDMMEEEEIIAQEEYFWKEYVEKQAEPPYNGKPDLILASIRKYGGYADKELPEIEIGVQHSVDLEKYLTLSEEKTPDGYWAKLERLEGYISIDPDTLPKRVPYETLYTLSHHPMSELANQKPIASEGRFFMAAPADGLTIETDREAPALQTEIDERLIWFVRYNGGWFTATETDQISPQFLPVVLTVKGTDSEPQLYGWMLLEIPG